MMTRDEQIEAQVILIAREIGSILKRLEWIQEHIKDPNSKGVYNEEKEH